MRQPKPSASSPWIIAAVVAMIFLAPMTFESHELIVDAHTPNVYAVTTTWWGLRREEREIKWMKPEGAEYASWCARSKDGEWYPFIVDELGGEAVPDPH
jgi:hypothetical protein